VLCRKSTNKKAGRSSAIPRFTTCATRVSQRRTKVVSQSFCGCLDKAVEELGVLKGIRAIMSQMIRTVGDMVEHIEGDDNFCEADQAIIEMVVDFGLSEIAKICKQKLDEEI
jgi:hypothetical protein